MAKQNDKERTRVEMSDSAATIAVLHQNWRRRLERVVGPLKVMHSRVERAEVTAEVNALRDGRKVGEK